MEQHRAAQVIAALLGNKSVTFAQVEYETEVKTAAAHKARNIRKRTDANVQLFSNIHSDVYANAVKRSAAKAGGNNPQDIADFQSQGNYFQHTDCYSIVSHKEQEKLYLYCIYNSASSTYTIDGAVATKEEVAQFLTPSAREKLLNPPAMVRNETYDLEHDVVVRTIALENILSIHASKAQVTL